MSVRLEETGLAYYDLQVQKAELDRKMEILKSKSQARIQENEKLSLFYQHELQQWLQRLDHQKIKWENKRDNLSKKCTKLQQLLQTNWSSTDNKLRQEKEKYCNVIIQLLPEWQKAIERDQMKQISQFEKKLSVIQQRRHIADIAFEKEKKLLSLLSIRQKQIQKLQQEEKQEALIREHERISILQKEQEYDDKLKLSKTDTFTDGRLQEYIIRKEVTSELERKYSDKFDEIKAKLIHNHSPKNYHKSTPTFSHHQVIHEDDETDEMQHDEEEEEEKNQEINDKHVYHDHDNDNDKDEEGNETQPSTVEFNAEPHHTDNNIAFISDKALPQKIMETNGSDTRDITNNDHTVKNLNVSLMQQQDESSSDDDDDAVELNNGEMQDSMNDTSKIERAVGLIEINHGRNSNENVVEEIEKPSLKISVTSENDKQKNYQSSQQKVKQEPKQVAIPPNKSKLKRAFRNRTAKKRLQFSVLASPNKDDGVQNNGSKQNLGVNVRTKDDGIQSTLSNKRINSLNDFEDVKPAMASHQTQNGDSSDDEFDF